MLFLLFFVPAFFVALALLVSATRRGILDKQDAFFVFGGIVFFSGILCFIFFGASDVSEQGASEPDPSPLLWRVRFTEDVPPLTEFGIRIAHLRHKIDLLERRIEFLVEDLEDMQFQANVAIAQYAKGGAWENRDTFRSHLKETDFYRNK